MPAPSEGDRVHVPLYGCDGIVVGVKNGGVLSVDTGDYGVIDCDPKSVETMMVDEMMLAAERDYEREQILDGKLCPYCGGRTRKVDSIEIYKLKSYGLAWTCESYPRCDSYIGAHKGTGKPLGRLAGPRLRELRKLLHDVIDPLWKNGKLERSFVYRRIEEITGVRPKRCHVAMFNEDQCRWLIRALKADIKGEQIEGIFPK